MLLLMILDGYGLNDNLRGNAVAQARKPNLDYLWSRYPHTTISASGLAVGLPEGQMGNSEVGHLNFGAGRIVYQEITRIDKAISDGEFFKNPVLMESIQKAKQTGCGLHLMGLVSDGGVHSSLNHLFALLELCQRLKLEKVYVHSFLDGRDTSPTAGIDYISQLLKKMQDLKIGDLSTVVGRYYGMDRDQRWDRTEKAYRAIVDGIGTSSLDITNTIKDFYQKNITDEFMTPVVVPDRNRNLLAGRVKDKDVVIFFNFRADRARQLSLALTDPNFAKFPKKSLQVFLYTMTLYHERLSARVIFPQMQLKKILGEIISENNLKQLRIAETEKYPHVTFFFNGGEEKPFPGEERILIPSPQVATYDLKPEMSAYEVTDRVVEQIRAKKFDAIILNFANPDMVGHTGILEAAVKAVETVDTCAGRVVQAVKEVGGISLVTADHGNCEMMIDYATGGPHTAHTCSPVPFILVDDNYNGKLRNGGILADVAPTMLELLNLPQPKEMEGKSLLFRD